MSPYGGRVSGDGDWKVEAWPCAMRDSLRVASRPTAHIHPRNSCCVFDGSDLGSNGLKLLLGVFFLIFFLFFINWTDDRFTVKLVIMVSF